jgi:chemotaxis protein CheX
MTEQPAPPALVTLADVLDLTAAGPLAGELAGLRGRPLSLNAAGVERLGALCLQVLLSARVTWAADGASLLVASPSPEFAEQVARFGAEAFVT